MKICRVVVERACEHLHQGGLARSVLADQGVNLSGVDLEVNRIHRDGAGEAFPDLPHLQPGPDDPDSCTPPDNKQLVWDDHVISH
jgi:hypothetical protein